MAVLQPVGALALLTLSGAQPALDARPPDCLFSGGRSELPGDCTRDPYRVLDEPMIQRTIRQLGLRPEQVDMHGCGQGRFSAWVVDATMQKYRINYPLSATYAFAYYTGPLAHELGHVAQLHEAGTLPRLRQQLENESGRVELGADFLAGLMFRRFMNNLNQQSFEQSLDLIGNYEAGSRATHSRPEARTSAFRMGFYYSATNLAPRAAHRDFQRNRYAFILSQMVP